MAQQFDLHVRGHPNEHPALFTRRSPAACYGSTQSGWPWLSILTIRFGLILPHLWESPPGVHHAGFFIPAGQTMSNRSIMA